MRLLSALLIVGATLAACADRTPVEVRIRQTGADAPCKAEIGGVLVDAQGLGRLAQQWRGRDVYLHGENDLAYRCVGGIIFELQRAGVRRIGFRSEPAGEENR